MGKSVGAVVNMKYEERIKYIRAIEQILYKGRDKTGRPTITVQGLAETIFHEVVEPLLK